MEWRNVRVGELVLNDQGERVRKVSIVFGKADDESLRAFGPFCQVQRLERLNTKQGSLFDDGRNIPE